MGDLSFAQLFPHAEIPLDSAALSSGSVREALLLYAVAERRATLAREAALRRLIQVLQEADADTASRLPAAPPV